MGKRLECIDDGLKAWLGRQRLFFVATAPLGAEGHVNCSPKGGDTFRVFGEHEVAYLDLTGSGVETISHLRENGRIVLMWCAFEGPPRIVRLHGRGEVVYPGHTDYAALVLHFPNAPGARAIIRVDVERVADSCGFAVPFYDYVGERDTLSRWAEGRGPDGLADYRRQKNAVSIDGMRGYDAD